MVAIGQESAVELFTTLSELLRSTRALSHRSRDMGATGTALGVLKTLEHGDARPGDLAAALHVVPSVISRTISRLEQDGLVARKVDQLDARASLIGLTALGHDRLSRVSHLYVQQLRQTFAAWTDEEAEQAVALLVRLDVTLSSYGPPELHRRQLSEALLPAPQDTSTLHSTVPADADPDSTVPASPIPASTSPASTIPDSDASGVDISGPQPREQVSA